MLESTGTRLNGFQAHLRIALCALALFLLAPATALAAGPRIVDLGATFRPVGLSTEAVVAGTVNDEQAAKWKDGVLTPLAPVSGFPYAQAMDINAGGDIVGRSLTFTGQTRMRGTAWPGGGGAQAIAAATGSDADDLSEARAVSDTGGRVAGFSSYCRAAMPSQCLYPSAASGGLSGAFSLLAPEPTVSETHSVTDVNSAGTVVGFVSGLNQGVMWVSGSRTPLGAFRPTAINDAGVMVGYQGSSAPYDPYLRTAAGVVQTINADGMAKDINASGDVIGNTQFPATPDAWVLHQGGVYQLDDLLPAGTTGWDIRTADGINAGGEIAGRAMHNGVEVGYLLTPDYGVPRLFGTVKSEDDQPLTGLGIAITGHRSLSLTTDALGQYSADLEPGTYTVKVLPDDGSVKPKPSQSCTPAGNGCTVTISSNDVRIDFVKGCSRSLAFGTNFAAVNGCFIKKSATAYETTEPFRFNGIDVAPVGKVSFDTLSETMTGGPVDLVLGEDHVLQSATLGIDFSAATVQLAPNSLPVRVRGVPIAGGLTLVTTAGSTTVTASATIPRDLRSSWNALQGMWEPSDSKLEGSVAASLSATTTNDDGLRTLGFIVAPSSWLEIPLNPGAPSDPETPNSISIDEVRATYDLVHHNWRVGGKATVPMGKTPKGQVTFDGEVMTNESFVPIFVSVSGDGIDRPIAPPGAFLQRVGGRIGLTGLAKTDPIELAVIAGISLGPKNPEPKVVNFGFGPVTVIPNEFASLDGLFRVADVDKDPRTLEDTTWTSQAGLKIWDYPVATTTTTWYLGLGLLDYTGDLNFSDPSGQILTARGLMHGWWDLPNREVYLEGKGIAHVRDLLENEAEFIVSGDGVAVCAGDKSGTYGLTYEWKTGRERIGGCDLEPFKRTPLSLPAQASAAGTASFTLPKGLPVAAVAVDGATGFTLTGPGGLKLKTSDAKAVKAAGVRAIPIPHEGTTYLIFNRRSGRFTISGAKVKRLRYAAAAPKPKAAGTLSGNGCRPTLSWTAGKIPGQELRFVESGATAHSVLGTSKKTRGKLTVKPAPGAGVRTLEVQVRQGGALRTTLPLATYSPVASPKPGKTGNLRRVRGGVAWDPVCGAARYEVRVGKGKPVTAKSATAKVRLKGKAKVTVTPIGTGGRGTSFTATPR